MMEPKVIKTEAEYERALAHVDTLMDAAPGSPEEDELELFVLLIEDYESRHYPIGLPDPVEAIKFRMEQQGLTREDMSKYLGSKVSEVLNHRRPLSKGMIRKLYHGLGIPAEVLLQEPGRTKVGDCQYCVADYPIAEMQRRGYFPEFDGTPREAREYGEELLERLFSVFAGRTPQPIYCKKTNTSLDQQALSAWQARVLHIAGADELPPFSPDTLTQDLAQAVVGLSYYDGGPALVKEHLNKKGFHFVVLQHLPKTYLDGASFYTPQGRPVIALTLRYDRLDNFWFTLAHELGHLCLHLDPSTRREQVFFDDIGLKASEENETELEAEAHAFARNVLIPPEIWDSEKQQLTDAAAIRLLASRLNISPAIVAGRMRWETGEYQRHRNLIGNRAVRRCFPAVFQAETRLGAA